MAAGLEVPRQVFAHGWLLVGGEKMSKSKLTGIAPREITDVVRLGRVPLLLPARHPVRAGRLVQLGGPGRPLPGRARQRLRQPRLARDRDDRPLLRAASCRPPATRPSATSASAQVVRSAAIEADARDRADGAHEAIAAIWTDRRGAERLHHPRRSRGRSRSGPRTAARGSTPCSTPRRRGSARSRCCCRRCCRRRARSCGPRSAPRPHWGCSPTSRCGRRATGGSCPPAPPRAALEPLFPRIEQEVLSA